MFKSIFKKKKKNLQDLPIFGPYMYLSVDLCHGILENIMCVLVCVFVHYSPTSVIQPCRDWHLSG